VDVITLVLSLHGYVVTDNSRQVVLQLIRKVQLQNNQQNGSATVQQLNESAVVAAGAAVERLPKIRKAA